MDAGVLHRAQPPEGRCIEVTERGARSRAQHGGCPSPVLRQLGTAYGVDAAPHVMKASRGESVLDRIGRESEGHELTV
jgi:hypothetical protein